MTLRSIIAALALAAPACGQMQAFELAASQWTPGNDTNTLAWIRPETLVGYTNGQAVGVWTDESTNRVVFAASAVVPPTVTTLAFGARSGVLFPGVSGATGDRGFIQQASGAVPERAIPTTVVMIVKPLGNFDADRGYYTGIRSVDRTIGHSSPLGIWPAFAQYAGSAWVNASTGLVSNTVCRLWAVFNGTNSRTSVDGITWNKSGASAGTSPAWAIKIGCFEGWQGARFALAEMVTLGEDVTDEKAAAIKEYFDARYGN